MYKKEQRTIISNLIDDLYEFLSDKNFDLKDLSRQEVYLRGVIAGIYLCDEKLCINIPKYYPTHNFMINSDDIDMKDKIKKSLLIDW